MKPLKIWNPKEGAAEEPQRYLRMMTGDDGLPEVQLVDEAGKPLTITPILSFHDKGAIYRPRGLEQDVGLDLDETGRLRLDHSD